MHLLGGGEYRRQLIESVNAITTIDLHRCWRAWQKVKRVSSLWQKVDYIIVTVWRIAIIHEQ